MIKDELQKIATLREQKGSESKTLDFINKAIPKTEKSGDWENLIKLYWEAHLVYQHIVMTEKLKPTEAQDSENISLGIGKMMDYAVKAKEVAEQNNLKDMLGLSYRFLGRAATFAGDHLGAKDFYETAISKFYEKNAKSRLEVSGFLSEALIRIGQTAEGRELAIKTYEDFYSSGIGLDLKKQDYFTWAVWMSGIPPRTANALLETGADFNKDDMVLWLKNTEKELKSPSGKIVWGDSKFQFRIDEINHILSKLEK